MIDSGIKDAVAKLEKLGDETRRAFEAGHRHEAWFQKWQSMPESAPAAEAGDKRTLGTGETLGFLRWNRNAAGCDVLPLQY